MNADHCFPPKKKDRAKREDILASLVLWRRPRAIAFASEKQCDLALLIYTKQERERKEGNQSQETNKVFFTREKLDKFYKGRP